MGQPAGQRPDLPGEGHPLRPPTVVKEWLPDQVRAEITFSRAHVGSGNAVHGGVPPLVYVDVLVASLNALHRAWRGPRICAWPIGWSPLRAQRQ